MRTLPLGIVAISVVAAGVVACGASDSVIVDVSGQVDTLLFTGSVDTLLTTRADTTFSPADTVYVTRVDTVFTPNQITYVTVVDTVFGIPDTTFLPSGDTIVTVDTTLVSRVDTVVAVDTVEVARVDTVPRTDTIIHVDTIRLSSRLVPSLTSLTLDVGQTATLNLSALTPLGAATAPGGVVWLSDAPGIASVNSTGRVRGESEGVATIFALASGLSSTIPATVRRPPAPPQPPPLPPQEASSLWPNLPAGLTRQTDFDVSNEPLGRLTNSSFLSAGRDWFYERRGSQVEIVNDPSAPSGRGKSMRFLYPGDWINEGGEFDEPGSVAHAVSEGGGWAVEGYFGFLMKLSSNWVNHPIQDKLTFWFNGDGDGQSFSGIYYGGAAVNVWDETNWDNFYRNTTIKKGTWYRWEWYQLKPRSLPGSGTVKLWITEWTGSGWGTPQLMLNFTRTFTAREDQWRLFEFSATYGGGGDPDLTADQYIYWDAATVWLR